MVDGTEIIILNEMWNKAENNDIINNITDLLINDGYSTFTERWKILMKITGSTKHTVYAWLNRGRSDVKIPFLKLCLIADAYEIEVSKLIGGNYIMEKKFAIIKITGNNEEVIKVFGNDKKEAIEFGENYAKENKNSVISCVYALFNKENKMYNGNYRVYNVWNV